LGSIDDLRRNSRTAWPTPCSGVTNPCSTSTWLPAWTFDRLQPYLLGPGPCVVPPGDRGL